MRALIRRITALAPPSVRRAAAGALIDLKSLPGRIADPELRAEPLAFIHNVGGGHFRAVGEHLVKTLQDHAGLRPNDRVLDIGCGTGRVATPLAAALAAGGSYVGFDVAKVAIQECRRRFARHPHMRFEHLDVWNGDYNRFGRVAELETVFPTPDGAIDLAFATSVFTHMRMGPVRRYLAESARVLAPGGRLAFTAFALQPGRMATDALPFARFDETSAVVDPRSPERAIAHDRAALEAAVADAGLTLSVFHRGHWAEPADYEGFQDLFVLTKP
jgi:SAM-dependent methyltransferase